MPLRLAAECLIQYRGQQGVEFGGSFALETLERVRYGRLVVAISKTRICRLANAR